MNDSSLRANGWPARAAAASQVERNHYVAMVAHEFRDSLMPILNAATILLRQPDASAMVRRSAALIDRQARIMRDLIEDLMNISRLQTGKLGLNRERIALAEVIRRCLETAAPFCEQRNQRLRVTISAGSVELYADTSRLIQALRNLIVNAAKFSEAGGEIRLQADQQGSEAVIRVIDDGIGIAAEDLEPIFARFIQGPPMKTSATGGGLGIGLFLARHFAEAHGGSLRATSPGPGMGSTFTLCVPCLPFNSPSGDPIPSSPPSSTRTTAPRDEPDRAP
jgi:signal transduction histidine kinase